MIGQVLELLALDGHVQVAHVREVALALPPRIMRLGEHHFSLRTRSRPPLLEPPLQTPQLTFLESPRVLPPQILKHRLRLNRRMQPKDLLDLPPYRFERIRSGSPSMSLPNLARQLLHLPVLPGRLCAIPAFEAAWARVPSLCVSVISRLTC